MSNQTAGGVAQWQIDSSHSSANFTVRHLMISRVRGTFNGVSGTITVDPDNLTGAEVDVEIDVTTVDTRDQQRDDHLRSADFFDVERFPKMTFKSREVVHKGGNNYEITGDLTIRDVTRSITLNAVYEGQATDPWGGKRIGFSATGSLDRRDYGLTWNQALETGGVLVGEQVNIEIEVEAVRQTEES